MNAERATKLRYLEMAMNDGETSQIRAEVFAVILEYHQAKLHADGGRQLTIPRHTEGVALEDLREGQAYLLTVTQRFNRVLHAQLVVPEQIVFFWRSLTPRRRNLSTVAATFTKTIHAQARRPSMRSRTRAWRCGARAALSCFPETRTKARNARQMEINREIQRNGITCGLAGQGATVKNSRIECPAVQAQDDAKRLTPDYIRK